jgi:hypothetical protein
MGNRTLIPRRDSREEVLDGDEEKPESELI